jgi:hypothetical protein
MGVIVAPKTASMIESEDYLQRKKCLLYQFLDHHSFPHASSTFTPHLKNLFLTNFKYLHEIDDKYFQKYISLIQQQDHKMDFYLIILIRFLFLSSSQEDTAAAERNYIQQLDQLLSRFIFWPQDPSIPSMSSSSPFSEAMKDHCFWSENHIFMYLSSALLYHERCIDLSLPCLISSKEISLLKIYLTIHAIYPAPISSPPTSSTPASSDGGMYETLSHVYLPYTVASLLNLYDFSRDSEIRSLSSLVIQKILKQLLLCTNRDGISTFTPSTRQFNKTQTRSWGHNVNQLIYLLTGRAHDDIRPTPLVDFLLTSSWSPSETLSQTFNTTGYLQQVMIHSTEDIRELYLRYLTPNLTPLDLVPFYWFVSILLNALPFP